jgi:hypothetical protein
MWVEFGIFLSIDRYCFRKRGLMLKGIPLRHLWIFILLGLVASACGAIHTPFGPVATPTFAGAVPVDLPGKRSDQAGDINSAANAHMKAVSGGDVFVQGLYERPFNAKTMDTYFPYLDIVNVQGFKDDTWGYATISMARTDAKGALPGEYAVELDVNKDGRGDWLIRASGLSSTQWTTSGVQAWKDSDGDIGGIVPMVADNNPQGGDGYETLVFDQGKGTLTDGAWARIKPDDSKSVEIAFKLSMVGSPASYAMGAWAGTNVDPALFDYNDHLTHPQAGSPNRGDKIYPIDQMAEIDNTCRLAVGFTPSGNIPGLCQAYQNQASGGSGGGGCPAAALAPCNPGKPVISVNPGGGVVNQVPGQ